MAIDPTNPQYVVIRDVCDRLERAGIQYMLTGSIALCYFAEPRYTRDIDIVIDLEVGESREFAELFTPDYYIEEEAVRNAIAQRGMVNALNLKETFKVDFIVRKKSPFHHSEFVRRKKVDFDGITIWIVSKEDLILSKLNWAKESFSEIQLRDLKKLLATGYDRNYVLRWIALMGLESVYQRAQCL